ncbi:pur operon repressor [Clostridium culturomicium]|uniref:pur operon repressor n=1 Tax=Clostridium culturomicium TaxID=1499683 RepID=UPI000590AF91|nr:pur operon repressor [Clostridium culturomicium]
MEKGRGKFNRNQRVIGITKVLTENPNKVITLNVFTEKFNAAKSTISEDIVIVREVLETLSMGRIETVAGASGGIKFINEKSAYDKAKFIEELCELLRDKSRVVPGNFLYITDIAYNPSLIQSAAIILSAAFKNMNVDYVVTIETKGIPLGYEVAKQLGVQLVTVRHDTKYTEGTTVSINYASGSSNRLQTMSLSTKSMRRNSRCIFIDDFMRGGGTAKGIRELLSEFDSELLGSGFLIDSVEIKEKLVDKYVSLVNFHGIGEDGIAIVSPSIHND